MRPLWTHVDPWTWQLQEELKETIFTSLKSLSANQRLTSLGRHQGNLATSQIAVFYCLYRLPMLPLGILAFDILSFLV